MKTLSSLLFVMLLACSAMAQFIPTSVETAHIIATFPDDDPSYVSQKSTEEVLKSALKERYEHSYVDQNNMIQWAIGGPKKGERVLKYKYNKTWVYYKSKSNPGVLYRPYTAPISQTQMAGGYPVQQARVERQPGQVLATGAAILGRAAETYGAITGKSIFGGAGYGAQRGQQYPVGVIVPQAPQTAEAGLGVRGYP